MRLVSWRAVTLFALAATLGLSCSGGSSGGGSETEPELPTPTPPPGPPATVTVSPPGATMALGEAVAFRGTHRQPNMPLVIGASPFDWELSPVGGAILLEESTQVRIVAVIPGIYTLKASLQGTPQLFDQVTLDLRLPGYEFGIDAATVGQTSDNVTGVVAASGAKLFVAQNNDQRDNAIDEYTVDPTMVQSMGPRRLVIDNRAGIQVDFIRSMSADPNGNVYAMLEKMDTSQVPAVHVSWEFAKIDFASFLKVTDPALWNPMPPSGAGYVGLVEVDRNGRIYAQTDNNMVVEFNSQGGMLSESSMPFSTETLSLREIDGAGSLYFVGTTQVIRRDTLGTAQTLAHAPPLTNITDLAVAPNGVIYVAQQDAAAQGSIQVLNALGQRVTDPSSGNPLAFTTYQAGLATAFPMAPSFTAPRTLERPQSLVFGPSGFLHVFDDLDHENAVAEIQIVDGGAGYLTAPAVSVVDGSGQGSGAMATAQIDGSGTVTAVTVTSAGMGYDPARTTVVFSAPPVGGTLATGNAFVDADISAADVVRIEAKL